MPAGKTVRAGLPWVTGETALGAMNLPASGSTRRLGMSARLSESTAHTVRTHRTTGVASIESAERESELSGWRLRCDRWHAPRAPVIAQALRPVCAVEISSGGDARRFRSP